MADVTVKVLEPATSYALLTLDEVKSAFGITTSDPTQDAQLQALIDQYSDVIATMCNRTFAKEKVEETWRGDPPPYENYRIFLTHYPVADDDIETVNADEADVIDYEIENASGKLSLPTSGGPIVVTYSGGYELPEGAPPALKHALLLLVQAGYGQVARGISGLAGVRSVAHKESRVQFFDPNASSGRGGGGQTPLQMVGQTVNALLYHYMRIQV